MRVLIVDDQATNRKLLRAQLEAEQFAVLDAEDGVAAMPILEAEPIEAVISDILMPRMDGFRLCYEVRRNKRLRELPFIFYTATYTSASDERLAFELGADDFLRKPASVQAICRSLEIAVKKTSHCGPTIAPFSETDVLKEYSERLVCKLEEKNIELLERTAALNEGEKRLRAILHMEAQLRQAHKLEAIGQLASGIAHDFNNILAAILGNVDLARADVGAGHPAAQSLDVIAQAGNRAKHLVQQILTFSCQKPLARRVLALGPIIEEAASLLRATLPAGVKLVISIAEDTPNVLADATEVHQILFNLCTNAWHALEDRPGRIEVELAAVTVDSAAAAKLIDVRSGRFVCLSVRDTGKGMDDATLERIFEPFFTTKEAGRGTGLGLSVVHGIVKAHNGAIAVNSRPGEGTIFQLYFPAIDIMEQQTLSATAVPSHDRPQHRGSGQCILYLDDEAMLVELTQRMLGRSGYRVIGFTHPEQALQAFRGNPAQFDLVVTDLNMPGLSGLEVAAEILSIRTDMPLALMSGYVTEELKTDARRIGIKDVIYKPTTVEEFSEAIYQLIAVESGEGAS